MPSLVLCTVFTATVSGGADGVVDCHESLSEAELGEAIIDEARLCIEAAAPELGRSSAAAAAAADTQLHHQATPQLDSATA